MSQRSSLIRIVGLGPGTPDLLTLGSREALRAAARATALLAPPELLLFLEVEGVTLAHDLISNPDLFVRGSEQEINRFLDSLGEQDLAIGVLGNPLSDFPGLPIMLRALEQRRFPVEIVPGVPRATLSTAVAMPLLPLPPASTHHTWHDLVEVMARLRRSCPWDREQTHESLVPYLIEETYELVDAIEGRNDTNFCEELGDLLLQIVFHAHLASERGSFSVADVIDALANKMIRRHPHVFGDERIADVAGVWTNWEKLKAEEPEGKRRTSKLDGIPKHLGSLQRAQKMQEKAARVGFDWPNVADVFAKLSEELQELDEARREGNPRRIREEIGDVIFTLVNLSRTLGVDAEGSLRDANEKFYRRFAFMERRAGDAGKSLNDLSLEELERLWENAKTEAA